MRLRSRAERFGLGAGAAAIVLLVAGFLAIDQGGSTPADGPSGALVTELLGSPTRVAVGVPLGLLGAGLLVWFGAALRERLTDTVVGTGSVLGSTAYGFAVLAAAGGVAHGAQRFAVTSVADREVLGEAIRALAILTPLPMTVLAVGIIGLAVTMGISALATGFLNRPLGLAGLALSVLAAGFLATDRGGPELLVMLWVAVAAGTLVTAGPVGHGPGGHGGAVQPGRDPAADDA